MNEVTPALDPVAIAKRCEAATPGPWYVQNPDDDLYMNAYTVTTDPNNDWLEQEEHIYGSIVAITLLQSPRYACIADGKYEENATFIAAARDDIPALLAEVERLRTIEAAAHRYKAVYEARHAAFAALEDVPAASCRHAIDTASGEYQEALRLLFVALRGGGGEKAT